MKWTFLLLSCAALGGCLHAATPLRALFNSLDPQSLPQNAAFYELYKDTPEGMQAWERTQKLLCGTIGSQIVDSQALAIFNAESIKISGEKIALIEQIACPLANRRLKGWGAASEAQVLTLGPDEIDLGRALMLSQPGGAEEARSYEAMLDCMALQVLSRLKSNASPEEKIEAMNRLIFEEMHFRFPPKSLFAQDIDVYTFLPSVLDNHLGVCLGVSTLYLCIAQRIGLPLEIITPPGHIYVRYRGEGKIINIETTARGINVPCEHYLGVNCRSLKLRTLKEVVGMTHFNQASTFLYRGKYADAVAAYEKALPYLPDDPLLLDLLGCCYILSGKKEEGEKLLERIKDVLPDEAVVKLSLAEDYLAGKADAEAICAAFMYVDEKRDTILKKQQALQKAVERCPEFRFGLEQLATCWLQLQRSKEALGVLLRYHACDPGNPEVEYYLAALHGERSDFPSCWRHLKNAEKITRSRDFSPKALRDLRRSLLLHCPEDP